MLTHPQTRYYWIQYHCCYAITAWVVIRMATERRRCMVGGAAPKLRKNMVITSETVRDHFCTWSEQTWESFVFGIEWEPWWSVWPMGSLRCFVLTLTHSMLFSKPADLTYQVTFYALFLRFKIRSKIQAESGHTTSIDLWLTMHKRFNCWIQGEYLIQSLLQLVLQPDNRTLHASCCGCNNNCAVYSVDATCWSVCYCNVAETISAIVAVMGSPFIHPLRVLCKLLWIIQLIRQLLQKPSLQQLQSWLQRLFTVWESCASYCE